MILRAPFPWYGGKSLAAPAIWQALGDVVDRRGLVEVVRRARAAGWP